MSGDSRENAVKIPDRYIAVDLETTGLDAKRDRIIEIGAVRVENGQKTASFHTMINPRRALEERIVRLTGISDEMVENAPDIGDKIGEFLDFCGQLPLLGHHVIFDYSFLKRAAVNQGLEFERAGLGYAAALPQIYASGGKEKSGGCMQFFRHTASGRPQSAGRCGGCPQSVSAAGCPLRRGGAGGICGKTPDLQGKTGAAGHEKAKRGLAVFTEIS